MKKNIYNSYDEIPFDVIKKFCMEQSLVKKISLHNTICWNIIGDGTDVVYDMDEFAEEMGYIGENPLWLANRIYYGDFKPCDDYWKFNAYGNLISYCCFEMEEFVDGCLNDELTIENENALRRIIISDWWYTKDEIVEEINNDIDGVYSY